MATTFAAMTVNCHTIEEAFSIEDAETDINHQDPYTISLTPVNPINGVLTLIKAAGEANEELPPVFKSIGTTIKTTEHETVLLPCYVDNLGEYKVKWWKDGILLAESGHKTVQSPNVEVFENHTLRVSHVGDSDSGQYVCQVVRPPPWGPIYQHHAIQVLFPPKVRVLPETETVDVELHQEITLTCIVTGVPAPNITWTFKGEEIPLLSMRNDLRFTASSSKMSGEYACIATNGVGDLASASIVVRVIYPPEVTTEKIWIHTTPGMRTNIQCDIDASPKAKVEWLFERKPVQTGARIVTFKKGNAHGLVLLNTKTTDFGFYTCLASNKLGKSQQVIQVSGLADIPVFKESYFKADEKNVTLAWEVDSYSSIIQYSLLFRQYQRFEKPENWSKLVIPGDLFSNGPIHTQTYSLSGLKPATAYETSVVARNIFGWSKPSAIFRFVTLGGELETYVDLEESTETSVVSNNFIPVDFIPLGEEINLSNCIKSMPILITLLLIFSMNWRNLEYMR
nr:neurotrimin [Halyomorpha halys]